MALVSCSPADLKATPLHGEHVRLKARMCAFGGWDMPLFYEPTGQIREHDAVRSDVGMFDVSHMGQVRFRGRRTLEFLNRLVPGKLDKLADGHSAYTQLCTPEGGILDDLIITRIGPAEYFAIINAATRLKDVAWMEQQLHALGYDDVVMSDESFGWGMIAVQGPGALELLEKILPGDTHWSKTPAFTLHGFVSGGEQHYLSRTGYTGEAGAELLCPAPFAVAWWHKFLAAGVMPCGLASRDSLRLEAGYCLYGNDLDATTSPVEAGLGWSVDWNKKDAWIGRDVVEAQRRAGPRRRLVGLKTSTRRPIRHGDPVVDGTGESVGEVTSGGYSPKLQCGIALAYVGAAHAAQPSLSIRTKTEVVAASLVKPPFVKTSLKP